MSKGLLIGIDLGTTVLKVCAFDARTGALRGQAAQRPKIHAYPDGGREQNATSVARAFRKVVQDLRHQVGEAWRDVRGIGVAAQGGSSMIAGRATGRPLAPMVLWNDGRTHAYLARIAEQVPARYWRRHVLHDAPPHGLGRLLWLRETRPELFTEDNIHIGAGEYLFFTLTGVWRQDAGNAIQIGSYNAAKKRLDHDPFRWSGLPLSFVAPLRQGHETAPLSRRAGQSLGLPEGVPVAGPYIDQEAAYMATAGVSAHPLQCSLGTAWVGNFVLPDDTTGWSPRQLAIPSPTGPGRLVIMPLAAGNLTWDWALDTFLDADQHTALSRAAAVFAARLLPPEGLVAFPWFTQPNPFHSSAYGGGAFFGLSAQTTREELLRAVAAGMTYELARVFDEVKRSGAVDSAVLGGGASNGPNFRKLIAALLDPLPVLWQRHSDLAAARGSVFAFSKRAARSRTQRVALPKRALVEQIRHGFERYCATLKQVYPSSPGGDGFHFNATKRRR